MPLKTFKRKSQNITYLYLTITAVWCELSRGWEMTNSLNIQKFLQLDIFTEQVNTSEISKRNSQG